MKAVRFHELGGPEILRIEEVPEPTPGLGQIRVQVAAIGVNFADVTMRYGQYFFRPTFPTTPGLEASGTVDAVGEGVTKWRVGDHVMAIGTETYAERFVVDAESAFPVPDGVDLRTAAALPINFFTAWGLLHDVGAFEPQQSVLIMAAAGGVGTALIQLVRREGGRPIAIAGNAEKLTMVSELGAAAIFYWDESWPEQARAVAGGEGVDLLLDGVGGDHFRLGWRTLRPYGRAVAFGAASLDAQQVALKDVIRSHITFTGFYLPTMLRSRAKTDRMMAALYPDLTSDALKPVIGGTFPLAEAGEAHRRLENRETVGKLLLIP